jgi:hypothetical protein
MRFERRHQLIDGDADSGGVGQQSRDERSHATVVLARRVGASGRSGHKRADTTLGFEDAGSFELGVHPGHGVGVDPQLDGELPHRRQLVAGPQTPGRDRRSNATLQLGVDRGGVPGIDVQETHSPIILVYWYKSRTSTLTKQAAGSCALPAGRWTECRLRIAESLTRAGINRLVLRASTAVEPAVGRTGDPRELAFAIEGGIVRAFR